MVSICFLKNGIDLYFSVSMYNFLPLTVHEGQDFLPYFLLSHYWMESVSTHYRIFRVYSDFLVIQK